MNECYCYVLYTEEVGTHPPTPFQGRGHEVDCLEPSGVIV